MIKGIAWLIMTGLSLAIAGYAAAIVLFPALRPAFAQAIFSARPVIAPTHFFCGAIALAVGAFQVNSRIRERFPKTHRWLGRLYVVAVTLGCSAAFLLAPRSSGGVIAHLGFALLAVCWGGSALNAYRHIRAGRWKLHRDWMMRSYALTFAAVTLRLYLPISRVGGIPFEIAYPAISWLCWLPNLLVVEWLIESRRSRRPAVA